MTASGDQSNGCRFCNGTGIRKWVTIRQPFGVGDWSLGKKTGESPCPNGCPIPDGEE